jgi:hypothetical protein
MIYDLEDYQFTATLLRQHLREDKPALFQAVCSNNVNIILDALDLVAVVPDLLAAGPDLLQACRIALVQLRERKSFVDMPDRPGDVEDVRGYLRAAIARAEGDTP